MRISSASGFTLIELMVGLAIAGILLAVAAPSWNSFVRNSRVTTATNDFMGAINLARTEAIKRQVTVILCRSANPTAATPACGGTSKNWTSGWILYATDGDIDERNYQSANDTLLRVGRSLTGVTMTADDNGDPWLAFNKDGSLRESAAAYGICDDRGANYGKLISIPMTGRPQVSPTDPNDGAMDCTPT